MPFVFIYFTRQFYPKVQNPVIVVWKLWKLWKVF